METGYIKIKENERHEFVVEAKLVNGTIWLTKHEIANLFNVFVNAVGNNLRSIFKSRMLLEDEVTHSHRYSHNGHELEMVLYNLEVIIFVSYRISSFEAKAFREWVLKSFSQFINNENNKQSNVLVIFNSKSEQGSIMSLN